MTKDAYLVGGPAAGKVVTIADEEAEYEVKFVTLEQGAGTVFHRGKYAPKTKSDLLLGEYHWMGETQ